MKCHRFPHENVPKAKTREMVVDTSEKLNFFPAKGGMHVKCHSPRQRDNEFEFGQCMQACQEPKQSKKNMTIEKTINVTCQRPDHSWKDGHRVLNLNTGRVVNTRRELPVTNLVIETVEKLVEEDGVKCLKFTKKSGTPICPNDWIAGADFNHQQYSHNWIKCHLEHDKTNLKNMNARKKSVKKIPKEKTCKIQSQIAKNLNMSQMKNLMKEEMNTTKMNTMIKNQQPKKIFLKSWECLNKSSH